MRYLLFCLFVVLTTLTLVGCGVNGNSAASAIVGPGSPGDVPGTLSGDTTTLVLTLESGENPRFTLANFFGPATSCLGPYNGLAAATVTSLGGGQWRMTFTIPAGADVAKRWRFNFVEPGTKVWLNTAYVAIGSKALSVFEGNFAFAAYVGTAGGTCGSATPGTLSGTTSTLVLTVYTGSAIDPRWTLAKFFAPPGGTLGIYNLFSSLNVAKPNGWWQITFTIPAGADVAKRWLFGFVDPATGNWLPVADVQIQTTAVTTYNGNFAFSAYVPP